MPEAPIRSVESIVGLLIVLGSLLAAPSIASAELVTHRFTGVVKSIWLLTPAPVPGTLPELTDAGVVIGAAVEGRFVYERSIPDSASDPTIGSYSNAVVRKEVRIGAHEFTSEVPSPGSVRNDAGR